MQPTKQLKYLFTAVYKDGRIYQQNEEDQSKTEPEKRNCFFDIKKDVEDCKLASFALKDKDGNKHAVNLITGEFEVNGRKFFMHEDPVRIMASGKRITVPVTDFQLVWFKQGLEQLDMTVDLHSKKIISEKRSRTDPTYCMGWRRLGDNKFQRIMKFE